MIYFDNNSTTRVFESTAEAKRPFLTENFANPASAIARFGGITKAIQAHKTSLVRALGAEATEQFAITSGATESNNLALLGAARANPRRRHVVLSSIEHPSVMEAAERLRADGYHPERAAGVFCGHCRYGSDRGAALSGYPARLRDAGEQ